MNRDILKYLEKIWDLYPESRFMQLMDRLSWEFNNYNDGVYKKDGYSKWEDDEKNIVAFKKDITIIDLFFVEDDIFKDFLEKFYNIKISEKSCDTKSEFEKCNKPMKKERDI